MHQTEQDRWQEGGSAQLQEIKDVTQSRVHTYRGDRTPCINTTHWKSKALGPECGSCFNSPPYNSI